MHGTKNKFKGLDLVISRFHQAKHCHTAIHVIIIYYEIKKYSYICNQLQSPICDLQCCKVLYVGKFCIGKNWQMQSHLSTCTYQITTFQNHFQLYMKPICKYLATLRLVQISLFTNVLYTSAKLSHAASYGIDIGTSGLQEDCSWACMHSSYVLAIIWCALYKNNIYYVTFSICTFTYSAAIGQLSVYSCS